jgi:hypothetical protein
LAGCGGHLGVVTSLIVGYIKLNLLLTDPVRFKEVVKADDWVFNCCRGNWDGHHPAWIASHINKLVTWDDKTPIFKPFDAETTQLLSDYLKLMFKCLYLHVKSGKVDFRGAWENHSREYWT